MCNCCMPERDNLDNIETKCCGWSYFNLCDIISWIINKASMGSVGTMGVTANNSI